MTSILFNQLQKKAQIGSVDLYPNLTAGLLALTTNLRPPGAAIFASAPPLNAKQPKVDTYPNLLALGILTSGAFPFPSPFLLEVPKRKFEVQSDFYSVSYTPAAAPTPTLKSVQVMQTPSLKRQVFVEPIPNILIKGIPAASGIPVAINQDFSQLQKKYEVYDLNLLWANKTLPNQIPASVAQPIGMQLNPPLPLMKSPVYDLNYLWPNSQLPNGIPLGPTVPNVVGSSTASALLSVTASGFVANPSFAASATVPAGFVISQTPLGGTHAILGSVISYVISTGAPTPPAAPTAVYVGRIITNPKRIGETALLQPPFDFISTLEAGETIVTAVVTASVYSGVDANPSAIISGTTQISGTKVKQSLTGGVVGTIYELACVITTSLSHVYKQTTYFAVKPDLV